MLWAWSQETVTSCPTKAVLLALADHADDAGFCRPSIERLSKLACLDPRTVQRQLKALEGLGLIRREIGGGWMPKSGAKNEGRASSYQLIGDCLAASTGEIHPGAVPPKMESTPAERRLRNDEESILRRQSATLTVEGKKVGGGSAHACEHTHASEPARGPTPSAQPQAQDAENGNDPPPPAHRIDPERLGELIEALGWARLGKRPTGDDLDRMRAWTHQLRLSHADQLEVIREVLASNRNPDAIRTFNYFSEAMQRRVGRLEREPLKPIYPTENQGNRANGTSDKHRRFQRIIDAASEGSSGQDWG